jgi:acetylglutamate kinase
MQTTLKLIKVGGKVVENSQSLDNLLSQLTDLQGFKVLVHGGGNLATQMATKLQIPTQMVEGRRITDAPMLDVVTMVYAGLVNKNIVAQLQAKGQNAIGLTGADLNLIEARKRPVQTIDYGLVGDVIKVNPEILIQLIENQVVPIIAPLTHDTNGQILNTNADTVAAELAIALSQYFDVQLYYCFEKAGVLENADDENTLIPSIDVRQFEVLKNQGVIHSGMIPKLQNSFDAIARGVSEVWIGLSNGLLQANPIGTVLRK